MADDQGNPQGGDTFNPLFDQISQLGDANQRIEGYLRIIADGFARNPNLLRDLGRSATTESQSNVSQGSKWKFNRDEPSSDPTRYTGRGNLLDDFENGIRDGLMDGLVILGLVYSRLCPNLLISSAWIFVTFLKWRVRNSPRTL